VLQDFDTSVSDHI